KPKDLIGRYRLANVCVLGLQRRLLGLDSNGFADHAGLELDVLPLGAFGIDAYVVDNTFLEARLFDCYGICSRGKVCKAIESLVACLRGLGLIRLLVCERYLGPRYRSAGIVGDRSLDTRSKLPVPKGNEKHN